MAGFILLFFGFLGIGSATKSGSGFISKIFGPFQMFGPVDPSHIDKIAFEKAKALIIEHEGYRNAAYKDTLGFLTVGIGHRVLPEDNIRLGQSISDARVNQLFEKDVSKAFAAAKKQAIELRKYDADLIAALTSVNFQLGTGWTKTFSNTWKLLKTGDAQNAVRNLRQSKWYRQTPNRVAYFIGALNEAYGQA